MALIEFLIITAVIVFIAIVAAKAADCDPDRMQDPIGPEFEHRQTRDRSGRLYNEFRVKP
jgi:hypothetical protein